LLAELLGLPEEHLGANAGIAECGDHGLVAGSVVLVHDEDDDRADRCAGAEIAGELQRIGKARHADGEAGCRHRFAAESRDQPVIAATAADRAEDHVLALFVLHLEGEFDLEDGARVVFEAADHGGVDLDAVGPVAARQKEALHLAKFSYSLCERGTHTILVIVEGKVGVRSQGFGALWTADTLHVSFSSYAGMQYSEYERCLFIIEAGTFRKVAALILPPSAQQKLDALRTQSIHLVDRTHDDQSTGRFIR